MHCHRSGPRELSLDHGFGDAGDALGAGFEIGHLLRVLLRS
jgi:hypothetical protein